MIFKLAVVTCLTLVAATADASTITYNISGVFSVSNNPAIPIGTNFTGTFVYDNAGTLNSSNSISASYQPTLGGLSLLIGSNQYNTGFFAETVFNDAFVSGGLLPGGMKDLVSGNGFTGGNAQQITIFLGDTNASILSNTSLPASLPLAQIESMSVGFTVHGAQPVTSLGFVTLSEAVDAPEPTSMLLLGTGLIGAGVRRYRQRRSSHP